MQNNQLTPQEAALYLGQWAIAKMKIADTGYTLSVEQLIKEWDTHAEDPLFTVKLLLRPLADIQEEEAKGVVQFIHPKGNITILKIAPLAIHYAMESVSYSINFNVAHLDRFNALQFQYLLSRGFDLFNWIEQGKALDKTKKGVVA